MAGSQPPTLCEVTYDNDWNLNELHPHMYPFRGVSSAKSQPGGRHNFNGQGPPLHSSVSGADGSSVTSHTTCSHTYYDYLKNYYWEHPTIVCNVRVLIN